MKKPKISVVMPSYNHEKFIGRAINSVLEQDFMDYEFLIADDCSSDHSREIIDTFKDSRIKKFYFEENRGAVDTLNFLIGQAQTDYIALINSDDYWKHGKLTKQYEFIEKNDDIAACFTGADIVDENEELMDKKKIWYADVFNEKNKTQGQWLSHFYFAGNCMCHPSILVRKKVYKEIGLYNPTFRQLPDFDMWIRLIKKYKIHIIEEPLVGHRRTFSEVKNTSAETPENAVRGINELTQIFMEFFDDMADEIFVEGFEEHFLLHLEHMSHEHLECEKAFIIRKGNYAVPSSQVIAINTIQKLLMNEKTKDVLKRDYAFRYEHYYQMTGSTGLGAFALPLSVATPDVQEQEDAVSQIKKILRKWLK